MPRLIGEQVRAEVHKYWKAIAGRSGELLRAMYFPNAVVFGAVQQRSELAQLMLTRRLREYAQPTSTITAEVGTIDVELIEDAAIASYPYSFRLIKVNRDGTALQLEIPFACATQIFKTDGSGVPRILHEHFGNSEIINKTTLPRGSAQLPAVPPHPAKTGLSGDPGAVSGPAAHNLPLPATDWIPPAGSISAEHVREAVRKFWQYFSNRSAQELLAMYFPSATVISAGARRSEPARLAIVRRTRELFGEGSALKSEIQSLDIQPVTAELAIASYSFHFNLIKLMPNGKRFLIDMPMARCSQVFQRPPQPTKTGWSGDPRRDENAMRIIHEHMSSIEVGAQKELPPEPALAAK